MLSVATCKRRRQKGKVFYLLLFLLLGTSVFAQKLSLQLKNASLADAFREVEKKSAYRFSYANEALEGTRPLTLRIVDENIDAVLQKIFENQPLHYTIDRDFILVKPIEKETIAEPPAGIQVQGRVVNESGEGINGASVRTKNGAVGTATDSEGKFTLQDVQRNSTLVISSVGYLPKEVVVRNAAFLSIVLAVAVSELDETVVIAYGVTTRRMNTGSVGRVSARDISRQPVSNPLATLSGRVPGLFITQGNGLPGSNFNVLIRGRNSIQNGTAPLYIIDGVPFLSNNDRLTQRSSLNANNPFNTIPPGDIESIEVLKDADATAIYGSRGANGVILITTKKAKHGQSGFDVQVYSGIGRPTRSLAFLDTRAYLAMRREAFSNDGTMPDASNAPDLVLWDTTRSVDWQKVLMGEKARTTNASLRYSGGNAVTRFSLSSNYYKETTVFPGDFGNQRGAVDLNVEHKPENSRFELSLTAGYGSDKSVLPLQNLGQYINLPPNALSVYDAEGHLNWTEGAAYFTNPVALLLQNYRGTTNRLTANTLVQYRVASSLKLKMSVGYNDVRFEERSVVPIASQNPANNPKGEANFGSNVVQSWVLEPQADYNRRIGEKGILNVLAGFTVHKSGNYSTLIRGTNYSNDVLLKSTTGAGSLVSSNAENEYRYEGLFGRIGYQFDQKYLVNFTGRRDGSSRFGPGNQFANFGAAGVGWIFSRERWVAQPLSFLSFGKLRASYGLTGSDQINNYQYLDTWGATQYSYANEPGFRPSRLFNPSYSWEQIRKLETALELGFLKDRVLLTAAWYKNVSANQIVSYSLPAQTGFSSILRNFPGQVLNKGWEFEATVVPVLKKQFSWTAAVNLSLPHNELLAFPGLASSSYATQYTLGKPLNMQMGYHYLGVNPQTGMYEFEDVNKNGTIDFDNSDFVYLGTTDPRFYGGLQNTVQFKGCEVSFLLEFRKQKGLNPIASSGALLGDLLNRPTAILQRWQKPGDAATYQRYSQDYNSPLYYTAYFLSLSDALYTDASFIRLKNLAISYVLPEALARRASLRSGRIFLQGQNLLTFTRYVGADPENQSVVGLSPLQVLTAGIQVTF